jgi:hypothetical protein
VIKIAWLKENILAGHNRGKIFSEKQVLIFKKCIFPQPLLKISHQKQ